MSTGSSEGQSSKPGEQPADSIIEPALKTTSEATAGTSRAASPNKRSRQSLEDAASELARTMGLPAPRGQAQRDALILAAHRALDAPNLRGVNLSAPEWDDQGQELDDLLFAGTALSIIRMEYGQFLTPEAWIIDADQIRDTLVHSGTGPTRFLSGDYRHANSVLTEICLQSAPSELAGQLVLLNAIIESQEQPDID